MDGVGEGEGVQHRIPIAELVGRVEARHPQRRRIGHCAGQLLGCRAITQGAQKGVNISLRVVGEQLLRQRHAPIPLALRHGCAALQRRL